MSYGHPGELAFDIEERQCGTCAFKMYHGSDGDHDFLMCPEIEIALVLEGDWPEEVDHEGRCIKYRDETLDEESAPEQLTLDTLFE